MLRQTAATATDVACHAVGRRHVVRAARFVLHRARLDLPNDLSTNGERSLQRWMLNLAPASRPIRVIDVGANVGRWSVSMLAVARQTGRIDDLELHAFEPSPYTFARLSEALDGHLVKMYRVALGERSGSANLHVVAPGAGINSLHAPARPEVGVTVEEVTVTTLDECASFAEPGEITLLKIDTEGHDLAVLRGAQALLHEQRILAAQFEYNHRWISARSFLRDSFELLTPFGYRLGKLTSRGVEFYPNWDPDLETFVEGNYVACVPQVADQLPSVIWWKSARQGGK